MAFGLDDILMSAVPGLVQTAGNIEMTRETNAANQNIANQTNQFNADQAQKQMDFQMQMSNTAHQREVQDMIKAGINPSLSAGGSGSSTPSGASATGVNIPMQSPKIELPDFMSTMISMKQLDQADQRLQLDKATTVSNIAKNLSETDLNKMKKILSQKGMISANLEGEASQVIQKFIQYLKSNYNKSTLPTINP